jgi:hypothetical protein
MNNITTGEDFSYPDDATPLGQTFGTFGGTNHIQLVDNNLGWNWYPYCGCIQSRSKAFEEVQEAILEKVRVAARS